MLQHFAEYSYDGSYQHLHKEPQLLKLNMPHKVGKKWKWGNIERDTKEELVKVVYGIWMKNGKKGSFKSFWKTGKVDESENVDSMITHTFDEVLHDYKDILGIDLSYMTFKIDAQPTYNNGKPCFDLKPEESGGNWTKFGWIRINPDIQSVRQHYAIDDISDNEFIKMIIRHELAHEIWNKEGNEYLKKQVLAAAKNKNFSTKYLETVKQNKLEEETFCEYLAALLDRISKKAKQ